MCVCVTKRKTHATDLTGGEAENLIIKKKIKIGTRFYFQPTYYAYGCTREKNKEKKKLIQIQKTDWINAFDQPGGLLRKEKGY